MPRGLSGARCRRLCPSPCHDPHPAVTWLPGDLNTLLLLGKPQQRVGSGVFLAGMQGAQGFWWPRPPWGMGSGRCVAPHPALQVWSGGSDPSVVLQLSLSSSVRFLPPELGSLHLPQGLTYDLLLPPPHPCSSLGSALPRWASPWKVSFVPPAQARCGGLPDCPAPGS